MPGAMPGSGYCHLPRVAYIPFHIMLTYQPECDTRTRVAWYGGESTQLHFQQRGHTERWIDIETRTLPFIPGGVKDLYAEMRDYYNYCYGETSVLDQDNLIGTIF
jgi:hypothetical protein